jgi:hypothetical protein
VDQAISESDARKEQLAAEAFLRIRSGQHWSDWMFIADGLLVGRAYAMRRAGTNQPVGRAYNTAFGAWMTDRPWARDLDKKDRGDLFWCADHRSEIEAWRETLAQNERARLNHPTALRRRYEASHKAVAKDPNAPKKETGKEALMRENAELWDKVKKLERQVEDGDGSLFDLRRDSINTIVDVIAGTVPLGRFESLQREMTKKLAALRTADKAKQAKAG